MHTSSLNIKYQTQATGRPSRNSQVSRVGVVLRSIFCCVSLTHITAGASDSRYPAVLKVFSVENDMDPVDIPVGLQEGLIT